MKSKRKRGNGEEKENEPTPTPKKARPNPPAQSTEHEDHFPAVEPETPTKRPRGRPPGSTKKARLLSNGDGTQLDQCTSTPNKNTPIKPQAINGTDNAAPIVRNADRSARRRSARTLIERATVNQPNDENDAEEEEDTLARKIWDADEDNLQASEDEVAELIAPTTPSKASGHRKGVRRKKSPTPPLDLPPHELYFFQNQSSKKSSANTLSSLSSLTHAQYHLETSTYKDPHASSVAYLHSLHARSFPQWRFELTQSFSICLFGYGSKRQLVTDFAHYIHKSDPASPKIIIINGTIPTLTARQILSTLATAIYNCAPSSLPKNLGSQPQEIFSTLLTHLHANPPPAPLILLINSLDAAPLRRAPFPSLLAIFSTSPHIHLLATCDTPSFPLLWDAALREQYNWLFHDTTTFRPYAGTEISNVVDEVNELLGRSGRSVKGKEGVGFVLRSLPENARNLYRVLVAEVLASMDNENEEEPPHSDNGDNFNDSDDETRGPAKASGQRGSQTPGIEYRVLYQKVVEEFICSSEMGFRTLLKEFHDHQMVTSRRDGAGAEVLGCPFRRQEMKGILEELGG
ncbi:Origin recognition complex subunit 2 [Toensbergia leucococca]|nr:Origin recognition complex subunit 2 [Toensbergia leucococca]